jgi:hypothetical protein
MPCPKLLPIIDQKKASPTVLDVVTGLEGTLSEAISAIHPRWWE